LWCAVSVRLNLPEVEQKKLRHINLKTCTTKPLSILAKSWIISFEYNIESVYFVYSNTVSIGYPTTYQNRQFYNNSKTNEDITTRFEQEYVRRWEMEKECVCSVPSCISLCIYIYIYI
jgi:hypothetical protein